MADSTADVPLLKRGDEQKWEQQLVGTIAGQPATLALYTYVEVSRDSEGNTSRSSYDFTLLRFRLPAVVAQRFRGVYLAPKSLSFGKLQDKMSHDRQVELESQAFHKRYRLRVVDEQDDIALYELFSPPFIELLSHDAHVNFEQVGDSLVIYRKGHETEAADLDRFCLEAWHVLQRYLEEHR
ncbi:MAG: hypothetical protein JWM25_165 [Thermoleophilia bacterium]|nr:hypothetical protein [Thermoleophilia bacterium]